MQSRQRTGASCDGVGCSGLPQAALCSASRLGKFVKECKVCVNNDRTDLAIVLLAAAWKCIDAENTRAPPVCKIQSPSVSINRSTDYLFFV